MKEKQTHDIAYYAAYLSDDSKLTHSASGGGCTALAEDMILRGGYVAGVTYTHDWKAAEYILTNQLNDLERLKGSKYIDVIKGTIYTDVKSLLDKGERVLFIGLPCYVSGLLHSLKKPYGNLITCELICHGPMDAKIHAEYIDYLEKKFKSAINFFSVRYKENGMWQPSYLFAKFENGKTFKKELSMTEYGFAFSVMGHSYCYRCPFKGDGRVGDIMMGDFWGATPEDIFWNEKGISSVFAETQKGFEYLKEVSGLSLFETNFAKITSQNPRVLTPKTEAPERKLFEKLYKKRGVFYAAHHTMPFKQRVKMTMPMSILQLIKKVYHLVKK